jgi:hypothetical protein
MMPAKAAALLDNINERCRLTQLGNNQARLNGRRQSRLSEQCRCRRCCCKYGCSHQRGHFSTPSKV